MIQTLADEHHRFEWSCDNLHGWLEVPLLVLQALDFTPSSDRTHLDVERGVAWLSDEDFHKSDMDRFATKWKAATGAALLYNYNKLSTDPYCPAEAHPIRQFPIFSLDLLPNPA